MPRFHFHLVEQERLPDEEGKELPSLAAAREEALENARAMVCHNIHQGWLNLDHRIEVTDEEGRLLFSLTFRDAFTIED